MLAQRLTAVICNAGGALRAAAAAGGERCGGDHDGRKVRYRTPLAPRALPRTAVSKAVGRADRPALTTLSRPFLPRFPPFFRRSFALSGFLAPRRRKWAKNGAKWAKNGQDRRLVSSALAALPTALWPMGAARAGSAPTARAASRRPSPRRARRWRARRCRSRATGAARSSPPSVRARFAAAFAGPFWRRSGFAAAAAAPASAFAFAPVGAIGRGVSNSRFGCCNSLLTL